MNTVALIKQVLAHENAHMISRAVIHRLVARLCILEPTTNHPHESQHEAQAEAKSSARECLNNFGADFEWFSETAEMCGLYYCENASADGADFSNTNT